MWEVGRGVVWLGEAVNCCAEVLKCGGVCVWCVCGVCGVVCVCGRWGVVWCGLVKR